MKKRPEITENTRQSILTSFCVIYQRKPIEKITVQEIMDKAGYNRCTFYQYFTDVYALRDAVEDTLIASMRQAGSRTSPQLNITDVPELLAFCSENEMALGAVLGDFGYVHFQKRLREILPMTVSTLSDAELGIMAPYFAELHLSISLSLFRAWLQNGKNLSTQALLTLIHTLYQSEVDIFQKVSTEGDHPHS